MFTAPFVDADDVVKQLADFDVLVAMRERTRFSAGVLSRPLSLKLPQQVAAIAHAFGMRVIAWSENLTAVRAAEPEVAPSGPPLISQRQGRITDRRVTAM